MSTWEGAILAGKQANHCKLYRNSAVICAETTEPIEVPFGLWTRMDPKHHVLHGRPDPRGNGQFWWTGAPVVKYRHFLS